MKKNEKIGFLQEAPGVGSSTRLVLIATTANAIFLTDLTFLWWLFSTKDIPGTIGLVVGSCVALFAGLTGVGATMKLIQKTSEVKPGAEVPTQEVKETETQEVTESKETVVTDTNNAQ